MKKLGISLYVEKSNLEEMKAYIDKAHQAGFSRIFSCLLSVNESIDKIKSDFSMINQYAHEKYLPQFADKIAELKAAGVTIKDDVARELTEKGL